MTHIKEDYRERCCKHDDEVLETEEEYKQRWLSIRIMYFTMFLMALGFSVVLTGVWPYLDDLDPSAGKEFMGYVVAANPLAQMMFSPLVGWWGNCRGSVRMPLISSLIVFTLASGCYSTLNLFPSERKYWMLMSRFFVGVSSGLQAAVTPLGQKGLLLFDGWLLLNMYTAAGWINVLLGVLNGVLFCPFIFKERPIAAKEAMLLSGAESEEAAWKKNKPDYLSAWTMIVAFFVLVFNFVLLETLGTLLTMDQFAWSKEQALKNIGILLSVGAVISCCTFIVIGPLTKRFDESRVLIWGGFLLMVVGRALYIPWGKNIPVIAHTMSSNLSVNHSGSEPLGCPPDQEWCTYTPAMTVEQFLLGFIFTAIGYPIGVTLIQTIFSKVLGPRPQGVWMGLMTGSGCLSRVLGPVFVTYVYTRLGTIWTFGITTVMMLVPMVWLQLFLGRITEAINRVGRVTPTRSSEIFRLETDLNKQR